MYWISSACSVRISYASRLTYEFLPYSSTTFAASTALW